MTRTIYSCFLLLCALGTGDVSAIVPQWRRPNRRPRWVRREYLSTRTAVALVALFLFCGTANAGVVWVRGPTFNRHGQFAPVPYTLNLEINGNPFEVEMPDSRARVRARIDTGTLEVIELRFSRWVSRGFAQLIAEVDDARFKINIFPIKKTICCETRLYTQTFVDHNRDWGRNIQTMYIGTDPALPLTFETIEQLDAHSWLIHGLNGPRQDGINIFDGTVGGRQFTVDVVDLGFVDWPSIPLFSTPEPASIALATLLATTVFCCGRRRQTHRIE